MYVAVKADLSHLSICTFCNHFHFNCRDAGNRQIHRKICKIYVRRDLQDVSKANMSNQLTRFLGKIPIRSVANDRQWKALSVPQKQNLTSGFRYLEAPKALGKAFWMRWLFLFDFHLCSVRWLWFAHARPSSGSKFSAQCFSITGHWCEISAQGR